MEGRLSRPRAYIHGVTLTDTEQTITQTKINAMKLSRIKKNKKYIKYSSRLLITV